MTITDTTATTVPDTAEPLPAYTGADTVCVMCSHTSAFTRYQAERFRVLREFNGKVERYAHLTARLERQCQNCDYQWDEALNPPAVPAAPAPRPLLAVPADVATLTDPVRTATVPVVVTAPEDRPQPTVEHLPAPSSTVAPVPLHEKPQAPATAPAGPTSFAAPDTGDDA
ncbi:hypothetical protein [Streptomyces sp. 2P-4]|uniref:hypothetical protein n=1 Tax=Streptomyces sp. 2P-4 TaxID=2931974 RepID=UPI00253FAD2C|nr:hypothetical protein [Streptomyces sp. 2P-4]